MNVDTPVPTVYGDWKRQYGDLWKTQISTLKDKFGKAIRSTTMKLTDVPIISIDKDQVLEILGFMKEETGFEYSFLADLTATDEEPRNPRFDVVYNLLSKSRGSRIRVKAAVKENEEISTIIPLWTSSNWLEREVWDMYGIKFSGHPDLRRILMDERWEGHPLRKDYPLKGYQIFPDAEPIQPELLKD